MDPDEQDAQARRQKIKESGYVLDENMHMPMKFPKFVIPNSLVILKKYKKAAPESLPGANAQQNANNLLGQASKTGLPQMAPDEAKFTVVDQNVNMHQHTAANSNITVRGDDVGEVGGGNVPADGAQPAEQQTQGAPIQA